jgi:hypothetical protein
MNFNPKKPLPVQSRLIRMRAILPTGSTRQAVTCPARSHSSESSWSRRAYFSESWLPGL